MNDDLYDFEVNDLIVNLPTDGSEVEIVTAEVPAGTYDEFNLEVNYDDDTRVSDPDFINEVDDDDGYSVVVRGIYDGEEVLFRTDEDYRSEEHTSELQSRGRLVRRLVLEKKEEQEREYM